MTEEEKVQEEVKEEINLSDEAILFPEAHIKDMTIKPWSFGTLFKVSAKLEKLLNRLEEKQFMELLENDFISYYKLASVFTTLTSEEVLEIIAITVDKPVAEVEMWDMDTGVQVAIVIFYQNKKTIKNALAPLISQLTK